MKPALTNLRVENGTSKTSNDLLTRTLSIEHGLPPTMGVYFACMNKTGGKIATNFDRQDHPGGVSTDV